MRKVLLLTFNLILLALGMSVIIYFWWILLVKIYISEKPPGGDFFNALTYANFIYKYHPFPPQGWLPFWNEGWTMVGGYPWLFFYLIIPLVKFWALPSAMEGLAAFLVLLYFISSFVLFWKISKNILIGFAFALITIYTKASYYQMTTVGSIVSAGGQFFLPVMLTLIYLYEETRKTKLLVVSGLLGGFAFLYHAPHTLLTTAIPAVAVLLSYNSKPGGRKPFIKIRDVIVILAISITTGSLGVYTLFIQTIEGSGVDRCTSPECWGVYPRHLQTWLNLLSPGVLVEFLLVLLIIFIIKRKFRLKFLTPSVLAFLTLVAYVVLAKLKLIDGITNAFFPTRIFWALNTLLLLIGASVFFEIKKYYSKLSWLLSYLCLIVIVFVFWKIPPIIQRDRSNTSPSNVIDYVVPEYQKHPVDDIVPKWMPLYNQNYRLDTFDGGIAHWWNYIATTPSVRGYSNHPTGSHRDWQYLLQLATRAPNEENQLLVKNKALFYIDQFGVGYRENSIASYPKVLLSDPKIMTDVESHRDLTWYKISEDYTSPIVFPNNSAPILVIGDNEGYKTIIRTISMQNLNSRLLIPVNGPTKIDNLNLKDLSIYKAVILYRFTSGSWTKLERYVENGGLLIINTADDNTDLKINLPNIFPFNKINVTTIKGYLNLEKNSDSELLNNIDLNNFSPFVYKGSGWKIKYGNITDLRKNATAIIIEDNKIVLAENKVGKGTVIWSGLNIPYHTVINENSDESTLFANFLKTIIDTKPVDPNYTITKFEPADISVETKNTTGILFKENYHSGWQARVNSHAVKVLDAGLDFIYVPIPLNLQGQHVKVEISFKGSFDTWSLFFLTIVSMIISVFYLVTPKYFAKTFKYLYRIFTKPFGTWFYSE